MMLAIFWTAAFCEGCGKSKSSNAETRFFLPEEKLINLIPLMVRQAHHERNQRVTVHPEIFEGFEIETAVESVRYRD
jgi:hypothetical protein